MKSIISQTPLQESELLLPNGVSQITKIFESCYINELKTEKINKLLEPFKNNITKVRNLDVFDTSDFYTELCKDITSKYYSISSKIMTTLKSIKLSEYMFKFLKLLESKPKIYHIPEVKMHFSLLTNFFIYDDSSAAINFINSVFLITISYFSNTDDFFNLILQDFENLYRNDQKEYWKKIKLIKENQLQFNINNREKYEMKQKEIMEKKDQIREKKKWNYIFNQNSNENGNEINDKDESNEILESLIKQYEKKIEIIPKIKFIDLIQNHDLTYLKDPRIVNIYNNEMIIPKLLKNLELFIFLQGSPHQFTVKSINKRLVVENKEMGTLIYTMIETNINDFLLEEFQRILYLQSTIDLFIQILKSGAVKEYYEKTIEYDKNQPNKEKNEFTFTENTNLRDYYNKFLEYADNNKQEFEFNIETMKKFVFLIEMKKNTKGFTTNYLRVAINYRHIKLNNLDNCSSDKSYDNLIQAYLILVLLHESCHFLRRACNINKEVDKIRTPRTNLNAEREGGEELFKYLFGKEYLESLNESQAISLLNPNNWESNKTLRDIVKSSVNNTFYITFMNKKQKWDPCVI